MHPIAFNLGSLSIHWYGVMVALGFVLGLWLAGRRGLREGVPPECVTDLGTWLIVGTLLGARTLYVVSYWREEFADQPIWEIFAIQHGGLVFYGGFIGATLAGLLFVRLKKLAFWKLADVIAPSIALGSAIGRIGCLFNGCCYGRPCSLPWAIRFPPEHVTQGQPVHPTEIYDSLWGFGLYLALAWLYRRKKFDGQVFVAFMAGYATLRSVTEAFRGDYDPAHRLGVFTPGQLVSLGVFAVALFLFWWLPRRGPAARRERGGNQE